MKRLLTLLGLVSMLSGLLPSLSASAFSITYGGVDNSNDYASSVIQAAGGVLTEKTSAAESSSGNDVTLYKTETSAIYIGYSHTFDGISADVYNAASGGSYAVKYWNGSDWSGLTSGSSISNNNDGTFQAEWTRPSNWSSKNILMDTDENGNSDEYSGSYYFVKIMVSDAYSDSATFSQIGIINYNFQVNVRDQFGNTPGSYTSSYSFSSSSGNSTVFVSKNAGNGVEYYGFYTPSSASYNYTATVKGFVQESGNITLSQSQSTLTLNLDFTHKITAKDAGNGSQITISSAYAGSNNTSCVIHSGVAYCPVPTSEDGNTATVSASGYSTTSVSIPNRNSDSDSQQSTTVNMGNGSSSSSPDLTVTDLYYSNDAVWADIKNQGGQSVSSNDTVYVYVYVDGTREFYGTVSYSYFSSGESNSFAFLGDELTGDDHHTIEVCIDATNDVNESSEGNNCRTETLYMGGSSNNDGPDLTVNDIYFSGDYLYADVSNEGDEDVDNDHSVSVAVYVDGDREYLSSYSYSYFEEGEDNKISFLNDNVWDDDEEYEVKVCIDYYDYVDESSESNNCRTEDLTFGSSSNSGDADLDVTDIFLDSDDDLNFTVTNKGNDDVDNGTEVTIKVYVDGDVQYTKTVTQSSSSTNFLDEDEEDTYDAGSILDDEGSTYEVEVCVDTSDKVDESSESNNCMTVDEDSIDSGSGSSCGEFTDLDGEWSEEYVCDLYERDVVSGKSDRYFYPNATATRAEFLKMVLLDAELDPYSVSSMHFSDVSSSSWYYSYVTYAAAMGYVDGYSDGTFKPNQTITRAEAVVILMHVADQHDYSFDEGDIDFWDVDVYDWFAYAVIIADRDNLVNGYSNGSFGPNNSITRGEAAKILDLAYDEYFN